MHQEEIEWALKTETTFKLTPHKAPEFPYRRFRLPLPTIREVLRVRLSDIIPLETVLELKQMSQ